jgi:hypothetical protein
MAMRKPVGYDETEAVEGGFPEPKPGPCILGIVRADVEIKDGEQRIELQLDIAEGPLKNHYSKQSKRFEKNRLLRVWQNTDGKSLPYFKGLIKAIEESNPGFVFRFEDGEESLERKLVGGNLREEEYLSSDGTVKTSLRVGYLCSAQSVRIGSHRIMSVKKLKAPPADGFDQSQPAGVSEADFDQSVPPHSDGDGPQDF